jgi:hypothetical protein
MLQKRKNSPMRLLRPLSPVLLLLLAIYGVAAVPVTNGRAAPLRLAAPSGISEPSEAAKAYVDLFLSENKSIANGMIPLKKRGEIPKVLLACPDIPGLQGKTQRPESVTIQNTLSAMAHHQDASVQAYGFMGLIRFAVLNSEMADEEALSSAIDLCDKILSLVTESPAKGAQPPPRAELNLALLSVFRVIPLELDSRRQLALHLWQQMLERQLLPQSQDASRVVMGLLPFAASYSQLDSDRPNDEVLLLRATVEVFKTAGKPVPAVLQALILDDSQERKEGGSDGLPWTEVRALARSRVWDRSSRTLASSLVLDDRLVAIERQRDTKAGSIGRSRLVVLPFSEGKRPAEGEWGGDLHDVAFVYLDDSNYYACSRRDGVHIYPLDGSAPTRLGLEQGLPRANACAAVPIGDSLAINLAPKYNSGNGDQSSYLLLFDTGSGQIEILAATTRRSKLTPLDEMTSFSVRTMEPNEAKQEVLMEISGKTGRYSTRSMWRLDMTTRTLTDLGKKKAPGASSRQPMCLPVGDSAWCARPLRIELADGTIMPLPEILDGVEHLVPLQVINDGTAVLLRCQRKPWDWTFVLARLKDKVTPLRDLDARPARDGWR